jgi:hypothetical protein
MVGQQTSLLDAHKIKTNPKATHGIFNCSRKKANPYRDLNEGFSKVTTVVTFAKTQLRRWLQNF